MNTVLVTPRSLSAGEHPALVALEARGYRLLRPAPGEMPDESCLLDAIPDCIGWIAGVEPVSARVIGAARRLRVISRNGSGVDNLPLAEIEARQITVCKAENANSRAVAELALALSLAALRAVPEADRGIRTGGWPRVMGREIGSARVCILGLGAIGQQAARLFAALGATTCGFDPFQPADLLADVPNFERAGTMVGAVSDCDIVTLHLPMRPGDPALLDAGLLGQFHPGTLLINTARAGLVDEAALLDALDSGQVGAYATDVFHREPPAPSPLLQHEKTILTSHVGGLTRESVERVTALTVGNLLKVLEP
ncbi:MAG: NAD(P)-dependent oxidoreductase [Tropicimonas sp.]|uniref:NAD(P)-dependent oxidoreductase n=1 Tax=Tropicimonas sp. TaxID=2067044 RepID=UPI003A8412E2